MALSVQFFKGFNRMTDQYIVTPRLVNQQTLEYNKLCDYLADGSTVTATDVSAVMKQIEDEGIDKILNEAGFEIRQPGCSACLAMNDDKVPSGKYCVSTSNRNFEGRQGPGARTILASPLVAAASAITGKITDPRTI